MLNNRPYQPLTHGPPHVPFVYHGHERYSAGSEEPQWIRCDKLGNVKLVPADRQRLLSTLHVPYRDLRMLDPSVDIPHPTSIFVRAEAIIVNFESIRMLITHDWALVLSVPKSGQSLLHGMAPRPQSPYVRHLARRVRPHGSMEEDVKEQQFDTTLPFELRCLEAALDTAITMMTDETAALELHVSPAQEYMTHRVTRTQLEDLRDLRSEQSKLASRVSKLKRELDTVLASDTEIQMLALTNRRKEHQKAAAALQRRSSRRTADQEVSSSTVRQSDSKGANDRQSATTEGGQPQIGRRSGEDADELSSSEEETPQHELRASLREVRSMLQTMVNFRSVARHGCQDPAWQVVTLLDTNLMRVEHLVQRLEVLKERIISTEKFIDSELDRSRNELVGIEIMVTAITMGFGFVSCVGGVFGMNLVNGKEDSHFTFVFVTCSSIIVAMLLCSVVVLFAYKRQLLSVPESISKLASRSSSSEL